MDSAAQAYKKRVIECAEQQFGPSDDGYYYWWPTDEIDGRAPYGCWSAESLRIIADELDERNKDWDEKIKKELNAKR
jgi:hypothetical protein